MPRLEDLLVNRSELDKELLAEVLLPLIGIDPERKEVVPKEGWAALNPERRILTVLLARKAMCAMPEVELDVESLSSRGLEFATGVKGGTLRPSLTRMKAKGLVLQDTRKQYYVPTTAVLAAKSIIIGGTNGQPSYTRRAARRRTAGKRSN